MKTKNIFLALVFITLINPVYAIDESTIPKILEDLNIKEMLPLLKEGTLVLIHKNEEGLDFASGIVLINAPVKRVWEVLTDYDKYSEFVPTVGRVKVVEKMKEDNWRVEYILKFKFTSFLSFDIKYYLTQYYKPYGEIIGISSSVDKSSFSDVRFREYLIDIDGAQTIFIYTAYANLASFGFLAELVYNAFPELITPTLVSVSTLFPEAVKERIEGIKLNFQPTDVKINSIEYPSPIKNISEALFAKIPPKYRIILFHNPAADGVRFATGITQVPTTFENLNAIIQDYNNYSNYIPYIRKSKISGQLGSRWSVYYDIRLKIVLPIDIEYTLDYLKNDNYTTTWVLDTSKPHDINGEWGRIEIIPVKDDSVLFVYTSFSHLVSSGFFMKMMMKNIEGFDMGLRVALTEMLMTSFKNAIINQAKPH